MQEFPKTFRPHPLLVGAGLWLLACLVYLPITRHGFVDVDDGLYVTGNPHVKAGLTLATLRWALTANVASNWHPLTLLSHALDWEIYGGDARGHHLTSLLLHASSAWILFEVLRRATGAQGRSAAVAALFAVHPRNVESVAWIAERKDVLSGFFLVLTLAAYLRYARRPSVAAYGLVVVSYVLGLASKSMLVTLPCVLLLFDVWPLGRIPVTSWCDARRALWPRIVEKLPLVALAASACAIAIATQQQSLADLEALSLARRVENALTSCASYVASTFWPTRLAAFYPLPSTVPWWKPAAAAALLLGISVFVFSRVRRAPELAVGWSWFLGMLVPVIGLVQIGRQAMADRYTYLPSIGLFVAIVWGVARLAENARSSRTLQRIVLPLGSALAVALLAFAARAQVATWKDTRTLFAHALEVTERNYFAHLNLGVAMARDGDEEQALEHYQKALEYDPDMVEAHVALGAALHARGRSEEALAHVVAAVRARPESARLRQTLATLLNTLGRTDAAIEQLTKALELDPDFAQAHYALGALLLARGQEAEALRHYQAALASRPQLVELYAPTAGLLAARGDLDGAARLLAEASRRQPDSAAAAFQLATCLERMGRIADAREHYARALSLDPSSAAARERLLATGGVPQSAQTR